MSCPEDKQSLISELDNFAYTEYKMQDIENNIDPENNLLININNSCSYYTEEQFNITFQLEHDISIIHFNSRSYMPTSRVVKNIWDNLRISSTS